MSDSHKHWEISTSNHPPHDHSPTAGAEPRVARTHLKLKRRYPTAADLREAARGRIPRFAFEYADGGAGAADINIGRNWASLDGVELTPRYGKIIAPPPCDVVLFGRSYTAPIGIAPIGSPSVVFPGGDVALAKAAQRARVPYVLGLVAGISVERAAELAADVLWFQLYRFHRDNHRIGMDILRRAEACGVNVMVLTMDTPIRTVRPRETKGGLIQPFRLTLRVQLDALRAPRWVCSMMVHGAPRFANLESYVPEGASIEEMANFVETELGGAFTWEEVARYRDRWKKPLLLKGILHPKDTEKAVSLGIDGIVVSNHGGRQVDALPASIDVLPAIVNEAGGKLSVMLDSGFRSGTDVARAIALGADAAFAGKALLWSLGALGMRGPDHMLDLFIEELRATLGQLGCANVGELRSVATRHPTAYRTEDFQ
jgi:(S)-mandelate dehydrogenase